MNKKNKVEKKRQKEQYVVEEMIRLYCRKNHKEHDKTTGKMCPSCQELSMSIYGRKNILCEL